MKFNISFKKHPNETGLRAVGYSRPSTDIKLNKKVIGEIVAPNWQTKDSLWRLRFTVSTKEGCDWKNIIIKVRFKTEPEARIWVKEYLKNLSRIYTFHIF